MDGGAADPTCSPPHAVASQEVEKSRIFEAQQANDCVLQAAAPSTWSVSREGAPRTAICLGAARGC